METITQLLVRFLCAWAWNKHDKFARSQTKDRERAKGYKNLCFSFAKVTTMRMFYSKLAAHRKDSAMLCSELIWEAADDRPQRNSLKVQSLEICISASIAFVSASHRTTGKIFWSLVWWLNGWSGSRTKCSAAKMDDGDVLSANKCRCYLFKKKFTRVETDRKCSINPRDMPLHRTPLISKLVVHPSALRRNFSPRVDALKAHFAEHSRLNGVCVQVMSSLRNKVSELGAENCIFRGRRKALVIQKMKIVKGPFSKRSAKYGRLLELCLLLFREFLNNFKAFCQAFTRRRYFWWRLKESLIFLKIVVKWINRDF